jgi:hypothetical protein
MRIRAGGGGAVSALRYNEFDGPRHGPEIYGTAGVITPLSGFWAASTSPGGAAQRRGPMTR